MFKDNEELRTYINMNETESQELEYKEGKSWGLLKYNITLAALALSNNENGGNIIIGVSEYNNNSVKLSGMSWNDSQSYNQDIVSEFINKYAEPNIKIQLKIFNIDKKYVVVIYVHEFTLTPTITKKSYDGMIIEGVMYSRLIRKNASTRHITATDMKRTIDLAITKNLKHYLKIFEASGLSIIPDKFTKNIDHAKNKLNEYVNITKKGYLEIVFKPIDIPDEKLSISDIRSLLEKSQNKSLHWGYPFLIPFGSRYYEKVLNDGILYNVNDKYIRGIFLYYDSGLFVNYQNLIEDMIDKNKNVLNVYYLITILTRAYRFAAKLSKHKIYNGKISLEFTLRKQKDRKLSFGIGGFSAYSLDQLNIEDFSTYSLDQCGIDDVYNEQPEIVTKETLEIKSDELAIKRAISILEKYARLHTNIDKELLHLQKEQDKY